MRAEYNGVIPVNDEGRCALFSLKSVSYTHLDVYKRQHEKDSTCISTRYDPLAVCRL